MTFIDWCSGLGGMRFALENLGHKCLGFCEIEEPNVMLHSIIHENEGLWFKSDIEKVDPKKVPEVDCYCISCPSFSCKNFNNILTVKKPKYVIMEGDSANYCKNLLLLLGYNYQMEQSTIGWKWTYAVAQLNTKTKIFPIGINNYMELDDWEDKGFPAEKLAKIKNNECFINDYSFIIRLSQIKALVKIVGKLES